MVSRVIDSCYFLLVAALGVCTARAECHDTAGLPVLEDPSAQETILGRVVSVIDGRPIEGATVATRLMFSAGENEVPIPAFEPENATTTDADGCFSLGWPLDRGITNQLDGVVVVRAPGYASVSALALGPWSPMSPGGAIAMFPASTLRGKVVDGTGKPIPRARITGRNGTGSWKSGFPFLLPRPVESDSSGRFEMEDMAAVGEVRLSAQAPGHEARIVKASLTGTDEVEIRLERANAAFSGLLLNVDGMPIVGGHVAMTQISPEYSEPGEGSLSRVYRQLTGPRGEFAFDELAEGSWRFAAGIDDIGYRMGAPNFGNVLLSKPVEIAPGANPPATMSIRKPIQIHLQFLEETSGKPVPGVLALRLAVGFLPKAEGPLSDQDGRVDVETRAGIPLGSHVRYLPPRGFCGSGTSSRSWMDIDIRVIEKALSAGETVTVKLRALKPVE